ncbi:MAG TPA: tetratricopeptide repeat protein [Ktedonosporobacter sp.]|nr:tetratricopeptide repeat protein [Ktedonosporobacter sp.]
MEDRTLSIHRLVQAVQMDAMALEVQSQWAERVIRAVNEVFPSTSGEVSAWPQCLRYLDQVQVCNVLIEQYTLPLVEAADVLNRTGIYLRNVALYSVAEPLYQRALAIREQRLGTPHPETATSLCNLAGLYHAQGRYDEAEPLFKRAVAIMEQELGATHPATATCIHNLAELYNDQGKYAEAEPLFKRALAISEKKLGVTHPSIAFYLGNLALLYETQGRYTEAEPLYVRALAIREQELGVTHPDVGQSLNNLAGFYKTQGKYVEAEPLFKRALAICEQKLGAMHPTTQMLRKNHTSLLRTVRQDGKSKKRSRWKRILALFLQ